METLLQSILATADMRNFQPSNMRAGLKGGVFFGLLQHTVFPVAVGNVECTAFSEKVFGAKGQINKIPILRIEDTPFDGTVELISTTTARVTIKKPIQYEGDVATLPQENRITYYYNDGKNKAEVVQTFANQGFFSGAYTEFWVTHNIAGYPNFNIRLWWERT